MSCELTVLCSEIPQRRFACCFTALGKNVTETTNCMHGAISAKSVKIMHYIESGALWVIRISIINWLQIMDIGWIY